MANSGNETQNIDGNDSETTVLSEEFLGRKNSVRSPNRVRSLIVLGGRDTLK